MRALAVSLGCTAAVCGLIELISPKDRYKILIETVIGLFVLITVVSLFKGADFNSITTGEISSSVTVSAVEEANDMLKNTFDEVIITSFENKLSEKGIEYKKITVNSVVKDNNFTVAEVVIYGASDHNEIKKIGDELGIVTVIKND